jgi:hypothetical protein
MRMCEMEQRALATLDEAGEENANALLNTIIGPNGSPGQLSQFAKVIKTLISRGLVTIVVPTEDGKGAEVSGEAAVTSIDSFLSDLTFGEARGLWTRRSLVGPPFPPPYPYVLATKVGRELAQRIVVDRGDDWWITE